MRYAPVALPILLLFACGDSPVDTTPVADAPAEVAPTGLAAGCYLHASETDTVSFRLQEVDGPVTGRLEYALGEKDRNTGTFIGGRTGDTISGDYFFQSEGVESTRQVTFVLRNGSLIDFSSGIPLVRTDCPD